MKCALWHDLPFREPAPLSILEATLDHDGDSNGEEGKDTEEELSGVGWDDLLINEEDDNNNVNNNISGRNNNGNSSDSGTDSDDE